MATYKAPLDDIRFILWEVFKADEFWAQMDDTRDVTRDVADAVLEEGGKICEKVLFPINRSGDEEGCQYNNTVVTTPAGFKEAFKTYAEGGWVGLSGDPEYGGQGMPKTLTVAFEEMLFGVNSSFALYPTLTAGASLCLLKHANDELKQIYLPKLYSGEWAGTMCLTEGHSGSDLGIIKTRAVENGDGTYAISGSKIFITGGEHDLTRNHIHLVLAKLPNAPEGPKGISLFLVPKFFVNPDGSLGERNSVACGSIEHKMGIKASATCVMNFDGAKGWLVGELNQGLNCMFTMMNYERLSIGLQGLGSSEVAYQSAVQYAKERLQGRAATGAAYPDKVADPIIVHPDVRRMLLTIRANNEAGRAFAAYVGLALDASKSHPDAAVRKAADNKVALLTPVAKAYFSDKGLEGCVLGQQVFGGHGYVREWGMEQLVRDVRIAQIYEGTNGIQAFDLLGRKIGRTQGAMLQPFVDEIENYIAAQQGNAALVEFLPELSAALNRLKTATAYVLNSSKTDANEFSAACVEYLHLFGLVSYAHMWALMVEVAAPKAADPFYADKVAVARFFYKRLLPQAASLQAAIEAGSASMMSLDAARF
ncbi:MAG TPA: acyl-CoA dehydrogenase C-terminal domain-containing protein [Pseudomonadales bacterium]|nr:acyl-CoA dehydrogenase C-terminal domain-containing protein [Pseudomonadales bacterium]